MRYIVLFVVAIASAAFSGALPEKTISSFEVQDNVHWGSLSAQHPKAGFYGQHFAFDQPIKLNSISVFIYDHSDHEESAETVNYGVWMFDGEPQNEVYLSQSQKIATDEVGSWKTIEFADGLTLEPGEYLIGIGQRYAQGFVAFGNARAVDGSKQGLWMNSAYPKRLDGSSGWFQVPYAPPSTECPTAGDCALMIRLNVVGDI